MDAFDKLLAEAKQQKAKPKKEEKPAPIPYEQDHTKAEAVVMVVIDAVCSGCGTVYSHPSKHLMIRADTRYFVPKDWITFYDGLPREIIRQDDLVDRCEACFEDAPFNDLVIASKKRRN